MWSSWFFVVRGWVVGNAGVSLGAWILDIINMSNICIACVSLQHFKHTISAAIQTLLFAYPTILSPPPSSNFLLSKRMSILFSTHPTPNSQIQQVSCISSSILPQPALWSHSFDEWGGDITWPESESLLWEVLEKVSSLLNKQTNKKGPDDKVTSWNLETAYPDVISETTKYLLLSRRGNGIKLKPLLGMAERADEIKLYPL